jgi:hypothetical protein
MWSLYPNPNDGSFALSIQLREQTLVEYKLLNAIGDVVDWRQWVAPSGQHAFQMRHELPAGIYLVQLRTPLGVSARRLIVE